MTNTVSKEAGYAEGRLLARPEHASRAGKPGSYRLGLDQERDALLYVPTSYSPARPAPFVVTLHGAGGSADNGLRPLLPLADRFGMILLSPYARLSTWDVIHDAYGPDVAHIDHALDEAFACFAVDADHVAIEGFSDGASYALSLGIANGDLFTHIMAFSPGFMAPTTQVGAPRIFVSHGTHDPTLRIDRTSRTIVPRLKQAGYDVVYEEFDGGHTVPPFIAHAAAAWFTST